MRAIWTGSIAFGLVSIGVKVYSATEDHDVPLHQVHDADGGRIRYQRRCEVCGREVKYEHVDRAYADDDQTVVITEDELKSLPTEQSREIAVLEFVPSEQIDPVMLSRSYYLAPDERAVKAYHLLRQTLKQTDRTAVVRFTMRSKTRLGVLRTRDRVLVLQGLLWDDEVREADFPELDQSPRLSAVEKESAEALVDSLSSDFTPERFTDDYQQELRQLVEAKLEEGESIDTEATFGEQPDEGDEGKIVDLTEALRRSVERARQDGSRDTGGSGSASGRRRGAKKSASSQSSTSRSSKSGSSKSGASKSGSAKSASSKSSSAKSRSSKSRSSKSSGRRKAG